MARSGLGWGFHNSGKVTSRTQRMRSRLYGGGCPPLSTRKCDRACMEAGAHLFLRASAIARHYDPTLTRTLPRSGDRS
ncbi:hypothetical protein J0895_04265 [Phormidium pseudopriestleyi FRX01]|uniref:Uncharacterized protein n=1 Tax=Phormidium pseudopriestleyi FRX01 TaxID=1759528 RepID=A0ABS3FML1_9CYAN|nr:hypothetical protein [Phormidium pseudopriestleyi]MBO0348331.1 hypothetical protein [Phormidium pseudopriestleyi FRX01]